MSASRLAALWLCVVLVAFTGCNRSSAPGKQPAPAVVHAAAAMDTQATEIDLNVLRHDGSGGDRWGPEIHVKGPSSGTHKFVWTESGKDASGASLTMKIVFKSDPPCDEHIGANHTLPAGASAQTVVTCTVSHGGAPMNYLIVEYNADGTTPFTAPKPPTPPKKKLIIPPTDHCEGCVIDY